MTYGIITDIAAPIDMYDQMHRQLLSRVGSSVGGLLFHLARATPTGFQIIEVWSSKERLDHYNQHLVWPLLAELAGKSPTPAPSQTAQEFEVRGLVVPSAGIGQ